jgi:ADP-ribosylglycohydrolase
MLTHDHERAFYSASKWTYEHGSKKLMELWKVVEKSIEIPSRGNMGKLKTSFTYSCIEINKKDINFVDCLVGTLIKGGNTETNCAIIMTLVGAAVGYNRIPGYFKQKIVNSRVKNSIRPRDKKYSPHTS